MRWTVQDKSYDEYSDEAYVEYDDGAVRPRLLLCLAIAAAGAVTLTVVWAVGAPALRDLRPWVLDHWIWATLPIISALLGLLFRTYLIAGKFLDENDFRAIPIVGDVISAPTAIGLGAGIIAAVPICWTIDGWAEPWNVFDDVFPGGITGFAIFAAAGLILAFCVRRWEYPSFRWSGFAWSCALFIFAAITLYLVAAGLTSIEWLQIAATVSNRLSEVWPVTLLGIVIAPQFIYLCTNPKLGARARSSPRRFVFLSVVGLLDFALVMYTVLYWLPGVVVDTSGLSKSEAASALGEERRTLLAITAAIGAGMTLIYTHLRHQLDRDANATGRYTEAVQQLGSENMSIRLGGVYALGRVAKDSPGDRETIFQLLASFVKDRGLATPTPGTSKRVALDVIAALRLVGSSWLRGSETSNPIDLRGWVMQHVELPEVSFPFGTDLTRANLDYANLRGAIIHGTMANGISLMHADLQDAIIEETNGRFADLRFANLRHATISGTRWTEADMSEIKGEFMSAHLAMLHGVNFANADLSFARFVDADLTDANFDGAKLIGTDFSGATLDGATFDDAEMNHAVLFGQDIDLLVSKGAIGVDSTLASVDYPSESAERVRDQIYDRINSNPNNPPPSSTLT